MEVEHGGILLFVLLFPDWDNPFISGPRIEIPNIK